MALRRLPSPVAIRPTCCRPPAGVDLTPHWTVFGPTGAWAFQLLSGPALAWLLSRGEN